MPGELAARIGKEVRRRVSGVPGVQSVEVVLQDHFVKDELHRLINVARAGKT